MSRWTSRVAAMLCSPAGAVLRFAVADFANATIPRAFQTLEAISEVLELASFN
jgi:hypothetical protein